MYKTKISTSTKQTTTPTTHIKKTNYDNFTFLRRSILFLTEENKKLNNRVDMLEKVIVQSDFSELININELQNINITNSTCSDINDKSLDNSIVNKKYVDLCIKNLNNNSLFKNNTPIDINCLINDSNLNNNSNLIVDNFLKEKEEIRPEKEEIKPEKEEIKPEKEEIKHEKEEVNKKEEINKKEKETNQTYQDENKELLQDLANELIKLQQGIQDIQKMNTFDNSKTLELILANPSIITQHNINVGYNPKNKSSKITLNGTNGDIYCSSINKLLGNLIIGKNIIINYNGNIKCGNIDTIGDINILKNLNVRENIKCNNKIVINQDCNINCNNIESSNIISNTLNIKNGEITEINNENPKSIINIEYLDNYPKNYYVETIINNLENKNYNKNDLILYQNNDTLTLMKFNGETFDKVNVKNGSLCIIEDKQEIYMKLKDKNDNQNWVKYLIKNE